MQLIQKKNKKILMDDIKTLLSELDGVITVSRIEKKDREKIIELENNYEKNGVIGLQNPGIRMVLKCNTVFAVLKDSSFRQPPGATVFMVEDHNIDDKGPENTLTVDNKKYRIIGEELIGKKTQNDEPTMFISDDFILYPGRRKGRAKKPAYFLIPPIEFPELEAVKDSFKIENIISVSPSTMADDYIRELCSFSLSEKLATILVGFDTKGQ